MIDGFQLADTPVLEFHIAEPMTPEDISLLRSAVQRSLHLTSGLKVLLVISDDSAAPSQMWVGAPSESLPETQNLEVAVVGPGPWFDALSRLVPRNPTVKAHHFRTGQRETALRWLLS